MALCPPSFHSCSVLSLVPLSSLPISCPLTHLLKAFSDCNSSFLRKSLVYKTHLGREAWLPGILVLCFSLTLRRKHREGPRSCISISSGVDSIVLLIKGRKLQHLTESDVPNPPISPGPLSPPLRSITRPVSLKYI